MKKLKLGFLLSSIAFIMAMVLGVDSVQAGMLEVAEKAYSCVTLDTLKGFVPSAMSSASGLAMAGLAVILKTDDGKDFEVKSPSEIEGMDAEGAKAYYNNLMNAQSNAIAELQEGLKTAKSEATAEMQKQVAELTKANNTVMLQQLKAQGEEMSRMAKELSGKKTSSPAERNAILKAITENQDKIKSAIEQKTGFSLEIDTKASQSAADITSGTDFAMMEGGVGQQPVRRTFMKSLFPNRPISTEYLKYNDQETIVRDAKNVAACATSTHNSKITWQVRTLQMKKVRDFVDVCVDMWEDYDYVAGEIRALVDTDVQLKVDEQLLLGDGTGANLAGVDSVASTFAAGDYAGSVQTPTLLDLIVVAASQISDFGLNNKYRANTVILNPIDATKMKLNKDADGNYLIPNYIVNNNAEIAGLRIIENQLVPVNSMYVMDSTQGVVYQRRGIVVELAFENATNFEQELVTVKAYERLNLRIRNVDANAFMKVTSISAALTAIAEV